MSEQPQDESIFRCEEIEQFALLYACDELDPAVRVALEAHTVQCGTCAAVVSQEVRLHRELASFDQPADSLDRSGLLLAQCRSQLAEALDDKQGRASQPGWRPVFSPLAWWTVLRDTLVYHPAVSMAALVVVGFLVGVAGQRLRFATTASAPTRTVITAAATPSPRVTDQQLRSAGSANVTWATPSGSRTPTVRVQFMSQEPMNVVGSPDDTDVMHALTYVLQNGQRFDPGARMDSLDVMRMRCEDPNVRRCICTTARTDSNPEVRRKALETLEGYEQDPMVRQTLVDALQNDSNSGVRVAAVNLLANALRAERLSGPSDPVILGAFRDRLRNDPSNYVRMQSAVALRQLGANELP